MSDCKLWLEYSKTRLAVAVSHAIFWCVKFLGVKSASLVLVTHNTLSLVLGRHFNTTVK